MSASPETVLKNLKQNQYAPLYFLYGEEAFYIDQISNYIEEHALTPAEKGFNQTIVYGKDVSVAQVLESARRFPMMAKRQVMLVKEAQSLQDIGKKAAQEQLSTYCKNVVPSTVLVFCYKYKKLDKRTELYKSLSKHAVLVESKKLYDNQVPNWIKNYCQSEQTAINEKATFMLSEYIGNDLSRIANELDKMLLNYEQKVEIDEAMVAEHVGISKEFNVFELQTALGKKSAFKANQIIDYFAANPRNNPLPPIISLLFSFFSKLLLMHHNKGLDKQALSKVMGVNPYFMQDYTQASKNYPLSKVLAIIHYIQQADLQSKGVNSVANDDQILKELVFKILHV